METTQPEIQTQPETQSQPGAEAEKPSNWKRVVLDIIETLVLAVVLYFGINAISVRVRVDGTSMIPTLQNGEYILINKLAYKTGEPKHGDIVVFRRPSDQEDLIKRVIGLPGEKVAIHNGIVTIDGVQINEPYIAAAPIYDGEWVVPESQLFVLGDNRNASSDSHLWNFLPLENVVGKAVLIYWPPPEWQVITHAKEVYAGQ